MSQNSDSMTLNRGSTAYWEAYGHLLLFKVQMAEGARNVDECRHAISASHILSLKCL